MALITWQAAYSVGVARYDEQHKKLVEMVNQLHDAMKAGQGAQALGVILQGLIRYTQTHFADEEQLLASQGYPELAAHQKEHQALVAKVLELKNQLAAGKAVMSQEVLVFLKNWLTSHIGKDDKQYGVFLNGKGIK